MSSTHPTMQRLFEATNMQPSELAAALNTSPQNITNWSARGISKHGAALASKILGVDANYILNGEEISQQSIPHRESNVRDFGKFKLWSKNDPLPEDEYVHLPFLKEVRMKGGSGNFELEDYNGYTLPFAKATLIRHDVDMERSFCCTLDGDSMEPVIPDGATIGISVGDDRIKDGKIYAFEHDGLFRVKRLYLLPGGQVRINSFNQDDPAYADEFAPLEEIRIVGRVFTWSVMA